MFFSHCARARSENSERHCEINVESFWNSFFFWWKMEINGRTMWIKTWYIYCGLAATWANVPGLSFQCDRGGRNVHTMDNYEGEQRLFFDIKLYTRTYCNVQQKPINIAKFELQSDSELCLLFRDMVQTLLCCLTHFSLSLFKLHSARFDWKSNKTLYWEFSRVWKKRVSFQSNQWKTINSNKS